MRATSPAHALRTCCTCAGEQWHGPAALPGQLQAQGCLFSCSPHGVQLVHIVLDGALEGGQAHAGGGGGGQHAKPYGARRRAVARQEEDQLGARRAGSVYTAPGAWAATPLARVARAVHRAPPAAHHPPPWAPIPLGRSRQPPDPTLHGEHSRNHGSAGLVGGVLAGDDRAQGIVTCRWADGKREGACSPSSRMACGSAAVAAVVAGGRAAAAGSGGWKQ